MSRKKDEQFSTIGLEGNGPYLKKWVKHKRLEFSTSRHPVLQFEFRATRR